MSEFVTSPMSARSDTIAAGDYRDASSLHRSGTMLSGIIESIQDQVHRGMPVDFGTLRAVLDAVQNKDGVGLDDRKLFLEKILTMLARIPQDSSIGVQAQHFLITMLYNDLPHPPSTYLSNDPLPLPSQHAHHIAAASKEDASGKPKPAFNFAYRTADGSCNNPLFPNLGAAHTPYARSVPGTHIAPNPTLPDPGLVFDSLLARDEEREHPSGLSACFFAFANLVIHSCFRTNQRDWNVNDTSGYVDLSPLYGVDEDEQKGVRRFDGTGRLWDDTFADSRMMIMPPAVGVMLIMFSRNHNYIAKRILEINEYGTLQSNPLPSDEQTLANQDEEIFQRARLVNCATFATAVMRDYAGCILRLIQDLSPFHLNFSDDFRDSNTHALAPRGEGNACSVEFNLLYRWHATSSPMDEKWLSALWAKLWPDKKPAELTPRDFVTVAEKLKPQGEPKTWTFGPLQRDSKTGKFDDGALAQILQTATKTPASAFGARAVPDTLRVVEVLTIMQSRMWGVCSLNQFRRFLGLKEYSSFKEWNPDPAIYEVAERLYHTIDNLELYVGMQAEETRPSIPGSGLCSGFTMSRAILADAVALVRGDRYFTVEYTPYNLSSWGYTDAQTADNNGAFGGILAKLLLRNLPQHYYPHSAMAQFPLVVPAHMKKTMEEKEPEMVKSYVWEEPIAKPGVTSIEEPTEAMTLIGDVTTWQMHYEAPMKLMTEGYGFYFGANKMHDAKWKADRELVESALFTPEMIRNAANYYAEKAADLIAHKSDALVRSNVLTMDVVHNVINYIPVHWAATQVACLPLKTAENPNGSYTEQELYGSLSTLFSYVFLNYEAEDTWKLEHESLATARIILADIEKNLSHPSLLSGLRDMFSHLTTTDTMKEGHEFLKKLAAENHNRTAKELAYNIFGVIVSSVASWAHAMTHVVNFYLEDAQVKEKQAIIDLSGQPVNAKTEGLLVGYVREALRLDPAIAGVLRHAGDATTLSNNKLKRGDRVFINLAKAQNTPLGDSAKSVNPERKNENLSFVIGAHTSLNREFSDKTMAHVLRAIFSLKNIRRGPGVSGKLSRFDGYVHGTAQPMYLDHMGTISMWPSSLLVQYDD